MIILGYNGFTRSAELFSQLYARSGMDRHRVLGHDAGAALLVDGKLVAAIEEERLCRIKKTSRFPSQAIAYVLGAAGLELGDVDRFAFGWNFSSEVMDQAILDIVRSGATTTVKFTLLSKLAQLYGSLLSPSAIQDDFRTNTGLEPGPDQLCLVPHHWAHLMCGYYLAGCPDAAFMISDGRAEQFSSVMGEIRRGGITTFDESSIGIKDSIALLYSKVTRYLGFTPNNDEYKVMGLSAFGEPNERNALLERAVQLHGDGTYRLVVENQLLDTQTYYPIFDELFGRAGFVDDWDFKRSVARMVQDTVQAVTHHQLSYLETKTHMSRLLLEGGVALNCVNNTALLERSRFEDVFVSFGASDCGIPIGAACFLAYLNGTYADEPASAYLGPEYDAANVLKALAEFEGLISWRRFEPDELVRRVAELLCKKVVVGWVQGRAEFGPRALGARSILANPSFPDIQDIINKRVKKRETFRPFAPIVLDTRAREVFEMGKKRESPFMTFVFPVKPAYRGCIRGACHVDGTARVQTVSSSQNPRLAQLLAVFSERTGIPCLINTSFNVAGEPIVCTPVDALRCFLSTNIDYLVLDDVLITSKQERG